MRVLPGGVFQFWRIVEIWYIVCSLAKQVTVTSDNVVLVVDDEIDMADSFARVLRAVGFRCLVAYDGVMALALIDAERPALVVSDITMPAADGFAVARHARGKSPEIPVILMTAQHSSQVARDAQAAGVAGYLRKPFANSELVAAVQSALDPTRKK
jgi:chemosensory pili system protein ChpA (sensor histidine kinase/response regulator)